MPTLSKYRLFLCLTFKDILKERTVVLFPTIISEFTRLSLVVWRHGKRQPFSCLIAKQPKIMETKKNYWELTNDEKAERIRNAEEMYCSEGLSPQKIANKLQCDVKTVYSWKNKYHWIKAGLNRLNLTNTKFENLLTDANLIDDDKIRYSIVEKLLKSRWYTQSEIQALFVEIARIKDETKRMNIFSQVKGGFKL